MSVVLYHCRTGSRITHSGIYSRSEPHSSEQELKSLSSYSCTINNNLISNIYRASFKKQFTKCFDGRSKSRTHRKVKWQENSRVKRGGSQNKKTFGNFLRSPCWYHIAMKRVGLNWAHSYATVLGSDELRGQENSILIQEGNKWPVHDRCTNERCDR